LTAVRQYPTIGPEDDDFHDEVLSDRWWETETQWFSWNVPERGLGGWTYGSARANAGVCGGGAWVWDTTGALPWELPYRADYSGLRLPPRAERDLRDFAWPTGVHVRMLEPLTAYEIRYDDPGALELDLRFEAIVAPNPHPIGVAPFYRGTHFDQPGRVTGTMALHGERIAVDCFATRDRSWGPRPQGPPPRRATRDDQLLTGVGGIGYCFGTASARSSFLVFTVPGPTDDPVVCGYLLRDGVYAHIVGGDRRVALDRVAGWPSRFEVDAVDETGRALHVVGEAVSRHWRGNGGDSLVRWDLDGAEAWGEDQTYLSKAALEARRSAAG
jgi:hypothetical protein